MRIGRKSEKAIMEAAEEKGLKTVIEIGEACILWAEDGFYGERCYWT